MCNDVNVGPILKESRPFHFRKSEPSVELCLTGAADVADSVDNQTYSISTAGHRTAYAWVVLSFFRVQVSEFVSHLVQQK